MGRINLTPEERERVRRGETVIDYLPGTGPQSTTWHDPRTGQEFPNLPVDPWSFWRYRRRGWLMGPASPELRTRWEQTEKPRPELKYMREAQEITRDLDAQQRARNEDLMKLVRNLSQQVREMKDQLALGTRPEATVPDDEPVEPTQLSLFDDTPDAAPERGPELTVAPSVSTPEGT